MSLIPSPRFIGFTLIFTSDNSLAGIRFLWFKPELTVERRTPVTGLEMKREGSMHLVPAPAVSVLAFWLTTVTVGMVNGLCAQRH